MQVEMRKKLSFSDVKKEGKHGVSCASESSAECVFHVLLRCSIENESREKNETKSNARLLATNNGNEDFNEGNV